MSELEVFAAALQIPGASERSDYLDLVCKKDTAQRQRIEALLRNHEVAGSFLATPAGGQLPTEFLDSHDAEVNGAERPTNANSDDHDENASVLDILLPSTRPGALGRLGHYEVLEVLGQGGFGTVVRAFDEKLHRMVAIKVMSSRLAATSPARKRFIREARSSAAIRHENVVAIHAIEEQPIPFLVMEFVAGETLQQRLDRSGPLDPADILRIGVQIAHGLAAAHAMGKIHRDIKPANILLENGVERVKITDFGLARAADDASLTQSGVIAGTPLYMAPEQAQGLTIDHRADLFSLGSVLYAMCSGRPPFRAATALAVLKRVAEDDPRPIHEIIPEVPEALCGVIERLHAKRPEDRFQTATEVADALGKYLREPPSPGSPSPPRKRNIAPPRPRSRRITIAAAALLLLALLGLGVLETTGVTTLHRIFSSDAKRTMPAGPSAISVVDNDADHRAAEYALSVGGTIAIIEKGQQRMLWPGNDIPAGAFDLIVVNFFRNRDVTDAGLDHFKECKYLVVLDVEKANVTPGKVLEMKRALPACRIEWDGDIALLPTTPDRRAADYVLSAGGSMSIKGGGIYRAVYARSTLPDGTIHLRGVDLSENQKVGDAELAVFRDCQRLQSLALGRTKVSDAGLAHLKDCPALVGVDLSGTQVGDAGLAHLRDHPTLAGFNLSATRITDAGLVHFNGHRKLNALFLNATRITDAGLANLKDCQNLKYLDLGGTRVSNDGLAHFKDCKNLARLLLAGTKVSDTGLAHFKNCNSLLHLDLGNTQVSDAGLAHFEACEKLAYVQLNQTQVGDVGVAHLKDCQNLNELNLANSQVSDAGLAQLIGYPRLYAVNVKNTKVTERGVKRLAADLPTCRIEWDGGTIEPTVNADPDRRVVEWLKSPPEGGLGFRLFADGKETELAALDALPKTPFQLRFLIVIRHPKMTDETLSMLQGLRHLTHLNIRQCNVGDAVLVCFKECTGLRELELHGTAVTDAGVARLTSFSKLQYVNLTQTAVTEAAVKKLAAALPKCKVEWNGGVLDPR